MHVLVVHAHPDDTSFSHAQRERALAALRAGGHHVEVADLYRDGLGDPGTVDAADALVFVHPTWWGGQPCVLKSWLDEVVSQRADPTFRKPSRLRHIRHLVVVTTYGSSRWINCLQGEGGKRTVRWGLRAMLHPRARVRWVACYGMDTASARDRRRFLDRVESEMGKL